MSIRNINHRIIWIKNIIFSLAVFVLHLFCYKPLSFLRSDFWYRNQIGAWRWPDMWYPTILKKCRKKVLQPVWWLQHFVHSYCLILFVGPIDANTTSPIAHVSPQNITFRSIYVMTTSLSHKYFDNHSVIFYIFL